MRVKRRVVRHITQEFSEKDGNSTTSRGNPITHSLLRINSHLQPRSKTGNLAGYINSQWMLWVL